MKVENVVTLSAYGAVEYGCGHTVEGFIADLQRSDRGWYRISTAGGTRDFEAMLEAFAHLPLGTQLKVTVEEVK